MRRTRETRRKALPRTCQPTDPEMRKTTLVMDLLGGVIVLRIRADGPAALCPEAALPVTQPPQTARVAGGASLETNQPAGQRGAAARARSSSLLGRPAAARGSRLAAAGRRSGRHGRGRARRLARTGRVVRSPAGTATLEPGAFPVTSPATSGSGLSRSLAPQASLLRLAGAERTHCQRP
jgi:hypothetical protein